MSLSALVGILVGSESDRERMQPAIDELDARGIGYEFEVRSAHRTPDAVAEYASSGARARPEGADLRRRPGRGAAGRRRGAHGPAGDRRAAALVEERARRARRAALDRADAAGRAGRDASASTTRRTRPSSRPGSWRSRPEAPAGARSWPGSRAGHVLAARGPRGLTHRIPWPPPRFEPTAETATCLQRKCAGSATTRPEAQQTRSIQSRGDRPLLAPGHGQESGRTRASSRAGSRSSSPRSTAGPSSASSRREAAAAHPDDGAAVRRPSAWRRSRRRTHHDIAAFVDAVAEQLGAGGPLAPLRTHLVGRRRHGARAAGPARRAR